MKYTADFETATHLTDRTYVWAWGVCSISNKYEMFYGSSIESFIEFIKQNEGDYFFHNLKFDGIFILDYLLKNNFKFNENKKEMQAR